MIAWLLALAVAVAQPVQGSDIVLVLDNSCSMSAGSKIVGGGSLPPNDPDRAAVLGALLVEGLVRGSADSLTIVGFGLQDRSPQVVHDAAGIRELPYVSGTWFRPALQEARDRLVRSTAERKVLLFFTDGSPSDLTEPDEIPQILGDAPTDAIALGLYGSAQVKQTGGVFLEKAVTRPENLILLDATAPDVVSQVVRAFTRSYAHTLGSRPEVGTLKPGGSAAFEVGRYVTEVMVTTASAMPGKAFKAQVVGPAGVVPARAAGDNGCPRSVVLSNAPKICADPRRHYQVFRGANDPYMASTWTLSLPDAPGEVEYGVILRYDLGAKLDLPAAVRVGEPVPIDASLVFRNQTFVDASFFAEDGFEAALHVAGDVVLLTHAGDGRFTGTWTPSSPSGVDPAHAEVRFTNTFLDQRARRDIRVEGFVDLELRPVPNPVDVGAWRGDRKPSSGCAEVDLSSSLNADTVPIVCEPSPGAEPVVTCEPIAGSEGPAGQPLRWQVCVVAGSCCGELGDAPLFVTMRGRHPHYAAGAVQVDVAYRVSATGFLRCWWLELAIVAGTLFGVWFIVGWIKPHDFDPALTVRLARTPRALTRASAMVLCEQPGGRRGFYRNARFAVSNDGTPIREIGKALFVVEAGPAGLTALRKAGGLERQNRRTRKWERVPEEDLAAGIDTGLVYRVGDVHLRFG